MTGFEPAIFDVTGRRFNQLKLHFLKSSIIHHTFEILSYK